MNSRRRTSSEHTSRSIGGVREGWNLEENGYLWADLTSVGRILNSQRQRYCLDPEYVERSRTRVVPANTWDLDIMTAAGYERFMEVVNDVRVMVEL